MRAVRAVPLVLILALALLPSIALAHGYLVAATPGPGEVVSHVPRQVTLQFSEPLNGVLSNIRVLDAHGRDVALPTTHRVTGNRLEERLPRQLRSGSYLVLWTSVSAVDGHVLQGSFQFAVRHAGRVAAPPGQFEGEQGFPGPLGALGLLARAVELAASSLWLALALFAAFLLGDVTGADTPALDAMRLRIARTLPAMVLLALLSAIAGLALQSRPLLRGFADLLNPAILANLLLRTDFGYLWLVRQVVVALALVVALRYSRNPLKARRTDGEEPLGLPLYLMALALGDAYLLAASGHAANVAISGAGAHSHAGAFTLAVALDWLHLLAAAAWAGGIVVIAAVILPATPNPTATLRVLDRYSLLAYVAVATLIVTGAFNAAVHVPSPLGDVGTAYVLALLSKIVLVLVLIGISGYTVFRLRPRLRAGGANVSSVWPQVRRWNRVAASLALGLWLATAVMNAYPVLPGTG